MLTIGIDNGLSGGVVALDESGHHVFSFPMPTHQWGGRRCINSRQLINQLARNTGNHPIEAHIEECPFHCDRMESMRSMGISYGMTLAVVFRMTDSVEAVKSGNALVGWQRQMLGRLPKGKTKAAALAKFLSIWPGAEWQIPPGCRVPNTGIVDAALIAEFGRTKTKLKHK